MNTSNVKQTNQESNTTIVVNDCFSFGKGWSMMPNSKMNEAKAKIMMVCGWGTLATFHNKRRGDVPMTQAEFDAVAKILSEYGIDATTGERV